MTGQTDLSTLKIAHGGVIKSAADGTLEGYAVSFTDETQPDLYKEFFNATTNFYRSCEEIVGLPQLYHHGLDETLGPRPIGKVVKAVIDDVGLWVQAQLDMADEYAQAVYNLAKSGKLGWSSGALPQSLKVAPNGLITDWFLIEVSATPTPAMPFNTVISAKSYSEMLQGDTGHKEHKAIADTQPVPMDTLTQKDVLAMNEEMMNILKQILAAVTQDAQLDTSEQDTAMQAMTAEPLTADETMAACAPGADLIKKSAVLEKLASAAVASVNKRRADNAAAIAAALNGVKSKLSQQLPASRTAHVGAVTPQQTQARGYVGGLSVSESLKYAHMTASDMAFTALMLASRLDDSAFKRVKMEDVGLTEDFIVHAKHKTTAFLDREGLGSSRDTIAVKSVLPFRANEIDSTTNTGYGLEWVSTFWGSEIWLKARAMPVYKTMIAKGMQEYEVPQGAASLKITTEGADPTVYSVNQNNDVGADNRPPVLALPSPFGTGNVSLSPALLMAISYYTNMLEEDSIIPIAAQLNYQMQLKMTETIEQAIINGDTATGANTNINLIDGTPGTTTQRPYYLNNNGILKYPLVTATTYSRSAGGAFSLPDFRNTLNLFGPEFGTNKDKMFWLMDYYTEVAALGFPEFATMDVAGRYATIQNGQVLSVYNIQNIVSGFMVKANSAGKVPAAGGTLGRLALVYAPYWALGYKRNVRLETGYYVEAQAKSLVATTRFDIVARGATASAISYNVGLS